MKLHASFAALGVAALIFASTAVPAQDSAPAPSIRAYQNYDFIPGETIVFADDFTGTQDGEFPRQWELQKGQGVVNKIAGRPALLLTDGNYATVAPRIKTKSYLGQQWTLEFDTYSTESAYQPVIEFRAGDDESHLSFTAADVKYYCDCGGTGVDLTGSFPSPEADAFLNRWHHVAIAVNGAQMKVYLDQNRVLSVPDMHFHAATLDLAGIGQQEAPIVYANVRLATGGGMNLVGKKFTEAKIVTHAINFDIDRATLLPESMGALNQIKSIMAADPALKFEIDGHTDSSGSAAHNQQLSEQRAEAVKAQLVSMGVDGSRLTAKGYGDTKPLGSNATSEGKANNRRVEFVRL